LVVERSLRSLSIALNMLAEASATSAMRSVICSGPQEFQALRELTSTMISAAVRITARRSADTVRRFNMLGSQIPQASGPETVDT
jgi:hypothetical protein